MPNDDLPVTVDGKQDPIRASNAPQITTAAETQASAEAAPGLDLRGYELSEHLGGGGMGDVYRAGDPALGRDLAVKVMKVDLQGYAAAEQRFLREARITGSLQHPGIVPIYNLGRLADGRLHYTMRLVRGRTFADILKEEAGQPERFPALLTIFEKVCQAVAYAHSKGVLHRDLKPANVMVGRFGEVQVMDWGLAKLLTIGDDPTAPEGAADVVGTRIHTEASETPPAQTRMGREMGTPAYMPPEQALGEWDRVDERADVFALGAILCEILTGEPPYSVRDGTEALRKAKRGELAEALARLEGCGADAALAALCRECLAAVREHRPRDAEQVAQRVAAYQAQVQERLRHAELERAATVVQAREEHKRRRWIWAAFVVLLAGLAGTTWQAVRATQAEDLATTAAKAEHTATQQAEQSAEKERRANQLAQTRLDQFQKVNGVLLLVFRDLDPYAEQKGGPSLRLQLTQHLERVGAQLEEAAVADPVAAANLQTELGHSLINLGQPKLASDLLNKAGIVLEAKLGADHPDTLVSRNNRALAYLAAGRTADAIRLHELTHKQYEAALGPDHPNTLTSRNNLATAYAAGGRIAEAIRLHEQSLQQKETKLGVEHPETLRSRNNLAWAYQSAGRVAEAIPLHEQNVKLYEVKLGLDHPLTLTSRNNLALAYSNANRTEEAIRLHEQTVKQMEAKLGPDHTSTLTCRYNLALVYQSAGRLAEAVPLFEQILKRREGMLGLDHPDTLLVMAHLGMAYQEEGKLGKAISLLETAWQRGRQRTDGLPDSLTRLPDALAQAYERAGQLDKAESLYRLFLEQAQHRFGPDDPRKASVLTLFGANLLKQKKFSEAEPLLRQGLTIRAKEQPNDWTTFNTRSALGEALLGQKKYTEAEPLLLQGYDGMKQRQDKIPQLVRQVRLTEALERLVRLYEASQQKDKVAEWRKKLEEAKAAPKKTKPQG